MGGGGLYLGLISGTSLDGVDAVIAEIDSGRCTLRHTRTTPYPPELRRRLLALIEAPHVTLPELGGLDIALGTFFAACAARLMADAGLDPAAITAIGHHGQTVYHSPDGNERFTLQLGDPNTIVARTAVTTIADFRGLDMALGGQGAPMVPGFHEWSFGDPDEPRAVVNIGGIANITLLAPDRPTIGYDTGPGNVLLDGWIQEKQSRSFDSDGEWAAGGHVDERLLAHLLAEPYFSRRPPKSTGREYFNMPWLGRQLAQHGSTVADRDVQATLAELTATTIADAIRRGAPRCARIIVCGGGAHNRHLIERLAARLAPAEVGSSERYGIAPDWVEAAAFAWLAWARLAGHPGNRPTVTGAREAVTLGGVYSIAGKQ